jgi:iron-regulated transporter 1
MPDSQQESHQRLLEESQSQSHDDANEQTQMQMQMQMQHADEATPPQLSEAAHRHYCRRLYISHVLSTWNSRLFEFGAFLFLANIYPDTLLPASVYALARAASAALLSPWLGSYIDRADRLRAVRLSISTNGFHLFRQGNADVMKLDSACQ